MIYYALFKIAPGWMIRTNYQPANRLFLWLAARSLNWER